MNKYVKRFFYRGLIFGGLGPVVTSFVYLILSKNIENFTLSGTQVFVAVVSTYLLAFIHAGASVFNQIEEWPITKAMLYHFSVLYVIYSLCYLVNRWIPFEPKVFLVFSAIFVVGYLVIWLVAFICVRLLSNKFNAKLN